MKSKAQKRQEARERIERSIPKLQQAIEAFHATIKAGSCDVEFCEQQIKALSAKLEYRLAEIERIKNREANPRKRKQADVLSLVA